MSESKSVRIVLIDGVAYAHMNDLALYIESVAKAVGEVHHAGAMVSLLAEKVRTVAHKAETER